MRALMIVLALVVTPFVASVSQGRAKPARPARRAAAPAAAQSGNCSQQQGQHQGNDACDGTPVPPPPPPPPPPATCVAGSAPAGDVTITGMVLQVSPAIGLVDWCVELLSNGVVVATAKTDGSGNYGFANIAAGSYMLCEVVQPTWIQTFPDVAFTGAVCPSGNAGYAMNLPPLSQSPFNDFRNSH